MTAIITKQNAKDKAFVGGGGGDGSTDGLFNSLHVLGDTTLDGAVTFTANNKTISDIITDIDIRSIGFRINYLINTILNNFSH